MSLTTQKLKSKNANIAENNFNQKQKPKKEGLK